jgi:hypothetical protein
MADILTKSQIAAFFRTIEADTEESAVIRGLAGQVAARLEATHPNGMIRDMREAFTNGASDTIKLVAILVAGSLALVSSPDLPAET